MRPFILLLSSLLIALVLGEGMLMLAGFQPRELVANPQFAGNTWAMRDPELGWSNRQGEFLSNEFGNARMTFWPGSRRASWHRQDKDSKSVVYILGGSFTQGYGVTDEETYVYRLNNLYPYTMFHNFGSGGYSTFQSLLKLRQLVREKTSFGKPELVIYGYIGDHERRNVATHRWVTSLTDTTGHYLIPPHVTVSGSELVEHPLDIVRLWPLESHSATINLLHDAALRIQLMNRNKQRRPATNQLIAQLASETGSIGSHFLVVLLNNVKDGLIPYLEEKSIAYLDCVNPDFETDPKYRVGGDGHPSALQHELWTDCLHRHLAGSG